MRRLLGSVRVAGLGGYRRGASPWPVPRYMSTLAPEEEDQVHVLSIDGTMVPADRRTRTVPETVGDILRFKNAGHVKYFVTMNDVNIKDAVSQMIENRVTSLIIVDSVGHVVGLMTERDVLRGLDTHGTGVLHLSVEALMTPANRLLYVSPDMSVEQCSIIMNERKVRNLPVIDGTSIKGLVGLRELSWASHAAVLGLKGTATRNTVGIRGIDPNVLIPLGSVDAPERLTLLAGRHELPHAYKDPPVSEDASFCMMLPWGEDDMVTFMGVADGVGSWRSRGVDPSAYSDGLMQAAVGAIETSLKVDKILPAPQAIIHEAWETMLAQQVIGSTTVCLATLDVSRSQLAAANIGDCGVLVLRAMEVSTMGSLIPAQEIHNELQVQYRSTQQLHAFNQPFQLGFSPTDPDLFETPVDAVLMRVPVEAGDIIVMASDGLFDNVLEVDIMNTVETWLSGVSDIPTAEDCEDCARLLAEQAKEASMDTETDSPFAVLAVENDILWSGGMPDDISVIVSYVSPAGDGTGLPDGVSVDKKER